MASGESLAVAHVRSFSTLLPPSHMNVPSSPPHVDVISEDEWDPLSLDGCQSLKENKNGNVQNFDSFPDNGQTIGRIRNAQLSI